jgi:carbon starvation protein CstA
VSTLIIAVLSFVGFFVAYHTYGRWLSRKIFQLDPDRATPSHEAADGVDYVATRKSVLFGHHFSSIAGTGPIVGPAIAVFWGWLPALLWVFFGCIFIGAVHDFGALVVSMRSRGQTIGDVTARMISKRARLLFFVIMFLVLMVVIAIFGLVIAVIFSAYPQSVLSVWISMPLAIIAGLWIYKKGGSLLGPSLIALMLVYGAVFAGVRYMPIDLGLPLFANMNQEFAHIEIDPPASGNPLEDGDLMEAHFRIAENAPEDKAFNITATRASATIAGTLVVTPVIEDGAAGVRAVEKAVEKGAGLRPAILIGSVSGAPGSEVSLPVRLESGGEAVTDLDFRLAWDSAGLSFLGADVSAALTQSGAALKTAPSPRTFIDDYSSSVVAWTVILLVYCFIASVLPVWLLLQPRDYINSHQLFVALALLMLGLFIGRPPLVAPAFNPNVEGAPPIFPFLFITIACGAVSGFHCLVSSGTSSKQLNCEPDAQYVGYGSMLFEGVLAVLVIIACCAGLGMVREGGDASGLEAWRQYYGGGWHKMGLVQKVGAFIDGGANMLGALAIPHDLGVGIIAVMVSCFAATTIDTGTRLQRYVLQELGEVLRIPGLSNKFIATAIAVGTGGALALISGPNGPGSGGLILWPLFGAVNQLLAGLAFLVVAFYLIRTKRPVWFIIPPLVLMIILPAWAMLYNIFLVWLPKENWTLVGFGIMIEALQIWMLIEGVIMWNKAKGVAPEALPPLKKAAGKN